RKSLRAPCNRACALSNIPRRAAISDISLGALMCKPGMLGRRMKSDVRNIYSESKRHGERLDGAIEVLVIKGVFIVPEASTGVGHLEPHIPDTINSPNGFNLVHCRACPRHDSRLLLHGKACGSKGERLPDSGYVIAAVRRVVIHVALAGVTLAPCVFMRNDVLRFSKIRRSGF